MFNANMIVFVRKMEMSSHDADQAMSTILLIKHLLLQKKGLVALTYLHVASL